MPHIPHLKRWVIALVCAAAAVHGAAFAADRSEVKPATEASVLAEPSDLQAVAKLFVSDKGRDWNAYNALPRIQWADAKPRQLSPGRYARHGNLLLRGFAVKAIPNGQPGMDYATAQRNEGESTLSVRGTRGKVESIGITKPFYSDDYLNILRTQLGATAQIVTIADGCSPEPYEEGAGRGAFFVVSINGQGPLFVQASQQDGGKYSAGHTVFQLTRVRPSDAIAELRCSDGRREK